MAHSCDPAVLAFFAHIHQVAFELWPMFGSRGAPVLHSASYTGPQGTVAGVQHPPTPPRIRLPAMDDNNFPIEG